MGSLYRLCMVSLIVVTGCVLVGCVHTLTPQELKQNEVHTYSGQSRARVYRATARALKTLGYEIVVADTASGKLKTSPKLITAVAHATASHAVATENALAWNIRISSKEDGAVVHAEPKGYSGGQSVDPSRMDGAYLGRLFTTLYDEISSNLR